MYALTRMEYSTNSSSPLRTTSNIDMFPLPLPDAVSTSNVDAFIIIMLLIKTSSKVVWFNSISYSVIIPFSAMEGKRSQVTSIVVDDIAVALTLDGGSLGPRGY